MVDQGSALPAAPQPGLPKTIGVLNVILGGLLFLCGGGCLNASLPFLIENNPFQLDPVLTQNTVEEMRRQMVVDLRNAESSAPSTAEKERLRKARAGLESKTNDVARRLDFQAVNSDLPWLSRYLWADLVSGPFLNIGLIASGIGLIFLKGWGRKLGLWVAAAKVIRLAVLNAFLAFVVVPHMSRTAHKFSENELIADLLHASMDAGRAGNPAAGGLPSVTFAPGEFLRILETLGYGYAVLSLGLGSIYPAVVLIVLSRPGVRAACATTRAPRSGDDPGAFGPPPE